MPEQKQVGLSHMQKINFVILFIFALIAVGLGVLKMRNNLYKPFALSNAIPTDVEDLATDINSLQYRDTDFDGLNDFEEIYVYKTSPYLEDSDSDGVKDKDELQKGLNPNCATGSSCSGVLQTGTGIDNYSTSSTEIPLPDEPEGSPPDIMKLISDPTALRKALISAGVSESILEQITDQQLVDLAKQTFITSTLDTGDMTTNSSSNF